jgi:hypothetical protein
MKPRIYLDTSVISVLDDARYPDRSDLSRVFWNRLSEFEAATSELARTEIESTRDVSRRTQMLALVTQVRIYPLVPEMYDLASQYISGGIFTAAIANDALHVAAAVLTRHELLVSWNFKHLVNRRRRSAVNALNVSLGLPTIEIIAPPEV